MRRSLAVIWWVPALSSCATANPTLTGTPTAGFGQTAIAGNLHVTPKQLLEDSRCPTDVQCVWAGQVRLRVEVDVGAGADVADLTLGTPTNLGGVSLTLTAVEPEKRTGEVIRRSAYRFTFTTQQER